jgi:hypothetical protein
MLDAVRAGEHRGTRADVRVRVHKARHEPAALRREACRERTVRDQMVPSLSNTSASDHMIAGCPLAATAARKPDVKPPAAT